MTTEIPQETVFSPCRKYRYTLWRDWSDFFGVKQPGYVQWICLNPSTADETRNDPTVRRCIDFSRRWGFGAMCMTNIFAFRATDPKVMKVQADPVGDGNTDWLSKVAFEASLIVCAWGTHGEYRNRGTAVTTCLRAYGFHLHCLGKTAGGHPKHPLYLARTARPVRFAHENH